MYRMYKEDAFDEKTYKKVYPCGSKTGVLYGLPKIHKKENPLRPIISAVGTYTHSLAKYLVEILSPVFIDHQFMLRDTLDFVNRVSEVRLTRSKGRQPMAVCHCIPFSIVCVFDYNFS